MLRLLDISASRSRRSSGTLATPMLGSLVANAYGAASAPPPVRALYSELFPALGRPTRPKRSMRPTTLSAPLATVLPRALGAVDLAVRRTGRSGSDRRGGGAAEAGGWDGVFVWDHLWNRTLAPFADPWVTLAAIAVATERVTIGTMVAALPRRRPQLVAQATTTLDRLSGRPHGARRSGSASTATASTRCSTSRPIPTRRAARPLDAGIEAARADARRDARADGRVRITTPPACSSRGCRSGSPGAPGSRAGPRRVARHGSEGLALVDAESWTPELVDRRASPSASCTAGRRRRRPRRR